MYGGVWSRMTGITRHGAGWPGHHLPGRIRVANRRKTACSSSHRVHATLFRGWRSVRSTAKRGGRHDSAVTAPIEARLQRPETMTAVEAATAIERGITDCAARASCCAYTPDRAGGKAVMAFEAAQSLARSAVIATLVERAAARTDRTRDRDFVRRLRCRTRGPPLREPRCKRCSTRTTFCSRPVPRRGARGLQLDRDPVFSRAWTLLGVPSVTIPSHTGPGGLPIGIQLIGAADSDRRLLATADWLFERVRNAVQE